MEESWVEELSDELKDKFGNEELKNLKEEKKEVIIKEKENIDFNKVKDLMLKEIDDLKLLEYQMIIASSIRKNFKSEDINYDECKEILRWLLKVSIYFMNKMKLQSVKNLNEQKIHRSSYKFCPRGCNCNYFYRDKKKCYFQHFVFNILASDIKILINYLEQTIYENIDKIEVKKTINTISFVIKHMYSEFSNLKYYNFDLSFLYKK